MKDRNNRSFGKWSAFCAVAAVFAASGQACPPGMPGSNLAGLWTGVISGEVTQISVQNAPSPPNPNAGTTDFNGLRTEDLTIGFNDSGLPTTLPLAVSAFSPGFSVQPVTAFNVGETQSITTSSSQTIPTGATFAITLAGSTTTTLTVVESVLMPDHFRVVYATTSTTTQSFTSTDPAFDEQILTQLSTGTLILDATAAGGFVAFSMDFNNNGTSEQTAMGSTSTGNGFSVGSFTGTLLPGGGRFSIDH